MSHPSKNKQGQITQDGQPRIAESSSLNEELGYHKDLKARQIRMLAIGGAIGTGLFMGAGGRLALAGPALVFVYACCGVFAFLLLRALGELVLHRPTSGSFVSYSREFFGEKAAFVVGWSYWMCWSMIAIADVTAIALYMNFFKKYVSALQAIPQWLFALVALCVVLAVNLISVKVFGELEFWFSAIKVTALIGFLLVGMYFVLFRVPVNGREPGFNLISDNGGLMPNGLLPALVITQGVIFAYGAIELIGTAAGETKDPEKVMPKAINAVLFRVAVFYVGTVTLLALLLPYTAYKAGESPFVTFFGSIGVSGADAVMNMVVLTAALSSLNAGLYSTGRIMRSLSISGSAPKFAARMNKAGVPYGGILMTAVVALAGVGLNAVVPSDAFEIVLNLASVGIITAWVSILACQLQLWRWSREGKVSRPSFRMLGAPYTGIAALLFLGAVVVLTAFDYPIGTFTITATIVVVGPALVGGWFLARNRVRQIEAACPVHQERN
ncbi:amino acid permease [Rhodococcus sp. NPDC057014]|uniref:amino acid permease n=1 Tax=Rhodococcus sp. NPDC057014 TaxID=3346000 RepID=UPI003636649A